MTKSKNEPLMKPVLMGRRYCLVPFTPEFHRPAYLLSIAEVTGFRWRFNGIVPTYDVFERSINSNVLVQFAVASRDDPSKMLGLVVAYNANPQDGYVYLASISDPTAGVGSLEGTVLMVNYLLVTWPFRKIYMDVMEYNVFQFKSAIDRGLFKEESRLVDHRYMDDRYWDQLTYAMYRDDAQNFGALHAHVFSPVEDQGNNGQQ